MRAELTHASQLSSDELHSGYLTSLFMRSNVHLLLSFVSR